MEVLQFLIPAWRKPRSNYLRNDVCIYLVHPLGIAGQIRHFRCHYVYTSGRIPVSVAVEQILDSLDGRVPVYRRSRVTMRDTLYGLPNPYKVFRST